MAGVPEDAINAIKAKAPLKDAKTEALRRLTGWSSSSGRGPKSFCFRRPTNRESSNTRYLGRDGSVEAFRHATWQIQRKDIRDGGDSDALAFRGHLRCRRG
jgi:hypothetical protein